MNWYEDDLLWERFYDCMFDEESFKQAQSQIPSVLALVDHDVETVLDIGCGPGRHCLALSKMGYDVTGVDTSKYLLQKAKEQSQKLALGVNFKQANMLDYSQVNHYDLIINMFNSFGYFDSQQQNQQVITNAFNNLKAVGTFIIDTVGKETLARTIEPVHLSEYDNGDIRIERPLLIDNMQIFSNQWILIRGDTAFKRSYQHYVYTPIELISLCKKAGFSEVQAFGCLDGSDYELESDRLVIVASKK